mgnify:CR=1 FL=1
MSYDIKKFMAGLGVLGALGLGGAAIAGAAGDGAARSCGRCAALSIPALGISRVPSPIGMEVSGFITTSHYAHHSWPPMADKCSYMDDLLRAGVVCYF